MSNAVNTVKTVATSNVSIGRALLITAWVSGAVLAQGFWSTFFAVILPFWAWYLVAERIMQHYGVI